LEVFILRLVLRHLIHPNLGRGKYYLERHVLVYDNNRGNSLGDI